MENNQLIPSFLNSLLEKQYGNELKEKIISGYLKKRVTSFRVNTIKTTDEYVLDILNKENISYQKYDLIPHAYILNDIDAKALYDNILVKEGLIYFQSLSSMLPPLFLPLIENDTILDMAAAPGGKTTEIAALLNNKATITALEVNKIRCDRLKYNVNLQGAKSVFVMNQDAKKLDDFFSFDEILLDAPCSGSGTLDLNNPKAMKAFSFDLVKNSSILQEKLLRKALKVLKSNHEMIYSTCSILEMENEDVLNKVLKEANAKIVPIEMDGLELLPTKIKGTILVMPNEYYEGFFIAKIKKN